MSRQSVAELSPDQIHVWVADLTDESQAFHFGNILSPDELHRASKFHFVRDRRHYIAARGILRSLLAEYLDVPAKQIQFRYSAKGRPELQSPISKLNFNIAHSGSIALYGFSLGRRIGV